MNKNSHQEALQILKNENILDKIALDMDTLGYVGERENKLLGYLIALSRKLKEPLSGIVVSSSGAGKSGLVELIQTLTPDEDIVFTSKLTAQSLYYLPKDFLSHKLLIVEERIGSELADYAVRTLQSKGVLSLAVPVKGTTQFLQVKGPVSVLETTSSFKLNLENISRCFILHLDESVRQTKLIHDYQRLAKSEARFKLTQGSSGIISLHKELQRLIKPYPVVIPYARKLQFPAHSASLRREHQKFLSLIEAVTLLYQYQRRIVSYQGIRYLRSSPQDYAIAYRLFSDTFKNSLLFNHTQAALLWEVISQLNKATFSRQDIARSCGWPLYQVRDNIRYLEGTGMLEIVCNSKGRPVLYRRNSRLNLTKPEELEE